MTQTRLSPPSGNCGSICAKHVPTRSITLTQRHQDLSKIIIVERDGADFKQDFVALDCRNEFRALFIIIKLECIEFIAITRSWPVLELSEGSSDRSSYFGSIVAAAPKILLPCFNHFSTIFHSYATKDPAKIDGLYSRVACQISSLLCFLCKERHNTSLACLCPSWLLLL